jgi:membrane protein
MKRALAGYYILFKRRNIGKIISEGPSKTFRRLREAWMYIVRILERMDDNHIFLSSAGIAYNTLLCFIPLLLIVFYLLGFYLNSEGALRTLDSYLNGIDLFPYQREQLRLIIVKILTEFVRGSHIAGIVGMIALVWTASALFSAVRTVLNRIFGVKDTKNFFVSMLKDFALLSIVGIALMVVQVSLYALTIIKSIGSDIFGIEWSHWLFGNSIGYASALILNFILFCVIFFLIPDTRLPVKAIALASGIASLLWVLAKAVFGYYLSNLWNFGKVYGPYAIIVATALWVYYSSMAMLFAAEVGEMYIERKRLKDLFSHRKLEETRKLLKKATPSQS